MLLPNATDARTEPDTNSPPCSLPHKYGRFSFIQFHSKSETACAAARDTAGFWKEGLSLPHTTSRASSLPALLTTGLAQDRSSAAPPPLQLILCLLLAERGLHFDQEGFSSEPPALTVIFLCHTLKTDVGQLSLWRAGRPQVEGPMFGHSHETSLSMSWGCDKLAVLGQQLEDGAAG